MKDGWGPGSACVWKIAAGSGVTTFQADPSHGGCERRCLKTHGCKTHASYRQRLDLPIEKPTLAG